jgi:hypothetical protein
MQIYNLYNLFDTNMSNKNNNSIMLSIPKPNKQAVNLAKEVLASANIKYQTEAVEYNKACVPEDKLEGYVNNWFKYASEMLAKLIKQKWIT